MTRRARTVVYHRPRRRRRAPAVVAGLLGLTTLVTSQLAVAGTVVVPGLDGLTGLPGLAGPAGPQNPVAVGPTAAVPEAVDPGAAVDPTLEPAPVTSAPVPGPVTAPAAGPTAGAAAPPAASGPAAGQGQGTAEENLRPVPTTTVRFEAGAVLDDRARADLEPVLAVLASPDAAPVLLTGTAEPGADLASSLRLAQQRAEAVAAALVEGGAPASLLRTTGVVDPDAGRSVVLAAEVP